MPQFVSTGVLFKGRHSDREIVVLFVGRHYTPEFEKRWKRYARTIGGSWRMDETYVKVRGEWVYLFRAADKAGKTVDFYFTPGRQRIESDGRVTEASASTSTDQQVPEQCN